MPPSFAKVIVHTVFPTKSRRPFLRDKSPCEELHRYLGGNLANHDCQPIIIGGVEDHVHPPWIPADPAEITFLHRPNASAPLRPVMCAPNLEFVSGLLFQVAQSFIGSLEASD